MAEVNSLAGQPGVLTATVTIIRKATGKVETYQLIGTPVTETQQEKEQDNGCNPLDRSA